MTVNFYSKNAMEWQRGIRSRSVARLSSCFRAALAGPQRLCIEGDSFRAAWFSIGANTGGLYVGRFFYRRSPVAP